MNAPSAKVRKRAAVQSLRSLAKDVGLDMTGKSKQPDMTKDEFDKLHKEVLAAVRQEEHTTTARKVLQEFLGEPTGGPVGAAGDVEEVPMEDVPAPRAAPCPRSCHAAPSSRRRGRARATCP